MTTPTAPRQTLHQLLEDAGTRSFVNNYTKQAVYHIADDGISRKEAIVLLAADLRRMQEEEVPEFTPVLRALEAAAGPQQVVAVETVGKLAPSATRTSLTHSTTTTTTTAKTLAETIIDAGHTRAADDYAEEAIYEVAEDSTRAAAIGSLCIAMRRIQQRDAPELTPILASLEQAAGPQRVIAFETIGDTSRFRDTQQKNTAGAPAPTVVSPVLAQAEEVMEQLEQAVMNMDLVYDFQQPRASVADRLSLMKIMLFRFARMANDAQNLLVEAGHVAGEDCRGTPSLSGEHKAHVDELSAVSAFELQGLRSLVKARYDTAKRVPPSQSLAYRIAKRAASEPRRTYWTRQTARRLGVQQLD